MLLGINAAGEALRSFFLDALRYQLNERSSPTVARIEKTSENVVGKDIVMALRYGRQGGVGNRADDGTLPTPYSRQTKQAKWETKNVFAYIQITDKTIEASKSNRAAFADLLTTELEEAETDARDSVNRQFFGVGSGAIGTVSAVSNNVLTLSSVVGLAEGMAIDSYSSNTAVKAGMRITKVDHSTNQVTVDDDGDTAVGNAIYINGNKDKELTGFGSIISTTGSIYGLDRDAYPWLKSQIEAVNGEVSEVVIQKAIDLSELATGGEVDYLMGSYGVLRSYGNLLTAQKRQRDTLNLKGGWKALSFGGIPLVREKYMGTGELAGIVTSDIKLYRMADWDWMDRDGAVLKWIADKPAYGAVLRMYCDIGCQRPAAQTKLTGITEH